MTRFDFSNVWAYAFTLEGAKFLYEQENDNEEMREFAERVSDENEEILLIGRKLNYKSEDNEYVLIYDALRGGVEQFKKLSKKSDLPLVTTLRTIYSGLVLKGEDLSEYVFNLEKFEKDLKGICLDDRVMEIKI